MFLSCCCRGVDGDCEAHALQVREFAPFAEDANQFTEQERQYWMSFCRFSLREVPLDNCAFVHYSPHRADPRLPPIHQFVPPVNKEHLEDASRDYDSASESDSELSDEAEVGDVIKVLMAVHSTPDTLETDLQIYPAPHCQFARGYTRQVQIATHSNFIAAAFGYVEPLTDTLFRAALKRVAPTG